MPDTHLERLRAAIKDHEAKQLQDMTVPPLEVLSRPITKADVAVYPVYFIVGPGREVAERTECGHGYMQVPAWPAHNRCWYARLRARLVPWIRLTQDCQGVACPVCEDGCGSFLPQAVMTRMKPQPPGQHTFSPWVPPNR